MGRPWHQAAAAVTLFVASACSDGASTSPDAPDTDGDNDRVEVTSELVADDRSFRIGARGGGYEVTYVVEDLVAPGEPQSTERLLVRPPFDSRLDVWQGPPPGADQLSTSLVTLDRLQIGGESGAPLIVHRPPGPTPTDLRIAPILDDALDAGLLELREQRLVGGRRCQVVRSADRLGASHLVAPDASSHVDSCFDADGILVEERVVVDGRQTLRRAAVEVEPLSREPAAQLEVGPVELPVDQGGGSVLPVDPSVGSIGEFWELPPEATPAGFVLLGRYAVVPPQPENFADEERRDRVVAGTADVYVEGADVVVIYQGATAGGFDAFAPVPDALTVDGEALGSGELLLRASGSELRFLSASGRFVHVIGTRPPAELAIIARSLVATEGTGLVYL